MLGDDVVHLAVAGGLIRRRWRLFTLMALLGALIGFGSSFLLSPGYAASSKVLLKGQPEKGQLLAEAQIAGSVSVLDRVADQLRWGVTGVELQRHVTADVLDG